MTKPIVVLATALLALAPLEAARSQTQNQGGYQTIDTSVVKKSVVFLSYPRGDGKYEGATGFLLSISDKGNPNFGHTAIVTARHVVEPEWAGCSWKNPKVINVRVNRKDYAPGGSASGVWERPFPLYFGGEKMWLVNTDDEVDVALMPITNSDEAEILNQDVKSLRVEDFATPEEIQKYNIGIGGGIISAGLVPGLWNAKRNYPAFKFGKISNVPDEPLKMTCENGNNEKDRVAWLIAGNFVPGNSGSPVLLQPLDFSLAPPFQFTGPRNMILGVLSGSIDGADLGEMVPIEKVFEIIKNQWPDADLYRGNEKDRPKAADMRQQ